MCVITFFTPQTTIKNDSLSQADICAAASQFEYFSSFGHTKPFTTSPTWIFSDFSKFKFCNLDIIVHKVIQLIPTGL